MAICLVEKAGETGNLNVGFQRSAQGACYHQPGIVPGLALEHPAPGIPVSDAGLGEHIATLDRQTPLLDDREDIGIRAAHPAIVRSEERRVGKACVSSFRSRMSPCQQKKKTKTT